MPRPLVIQTEDLAPAASLFLQERCELAVCASTQEARYAELLARAAGLVVRTYTRVDVAMLERAPRLKVVGRAGVGLDAIDVEACRRRGVRVVYTPDANSQAVAEYVFAMLFDVLRPRAFLKKSLRMQEWNTLRRELLAPRQLGDLTLGVLGLGRIGRRVARIGGALGMRVVFHDVREIPELERERAVCVSREELLTQSDVVTIHVDNRPENRHLIGETTLGMMKPAAILINTSRGFVVDAAALAEFLARNRGAHAMLDVHDPEPFREDHVLLGMPSAHLSPHIAAGTMAAHEAMSWVVRDVWRVLEGHEPQFAAC
jgi:D-3-phosphoglycerate dehydrogenase